MLIFDTKTIGIYVQKTEMSDRKPTRVAEQERADRGEVTLNEKRMGVPNRNDLRRMHSYKDDDDRHWVRLVDSRIVCYRNTPRIRAPELHEEVAGFGIIDEIMQITKTTWLVFFN